MSPAETVVVMMVAIGVIALLMKWFSRDEKAGSAPKPRDQVEALLDEVSDADEGVETDIVAIASDGWAFVPDGHGVQLIPPDEDGSFPTHTGGSSGSSPVAHLEPEGGSGKVVTTPFHHRGGAHSKPGERLHSGDFTGARVKRGAPDLDPWRLEAVGRDGDYRAWFFETEEAARAAHELLERRIVRAPKDEYGDSVPLTADDFEAARQLDEETERALDAPDDRGL